jgi:hypothetical protein
LLYFLGIRTKKMVFLKNLLINEILLIEARISNYSLCLNIVV